MPKDNEVDEKVIQRDALNDLLDNLSHDAGDVDDFAPSIDADEDAYWAYHQYHGIISLRRDAATVAELRADRDSWREQAEDRLREWDKLRVEVAENEAVINVWRRRCEAAERRVGELERDALRYRQLKRGRGQPFGDTFIIKKFNRTFGEEESVSWSDMERELDADIKHAALTGADPT